MLKKTGKNILKDQTKKFLEKKSINSRNWKIVHEIERRLVNHSESERE